MKSMHFSSGVCPVHSAAARNDIGKKRESEKSSLVHLGMASRCAAAGRRERTSEATFDGRNRDSTRR